MRAGRRQYDPGLVLTKQGSVVRKRVGEEAYGTFRDNTASFLSIAMYFKIRWSRDEMLFQGVERTQPLVRDG